AEAEAAAIVARAPGLAEPRQREPPEGDRRHEECLVGLYRVAARVLVVVRGRCAFHDIATPGKVGAVERIEAESRQGVARAVTLRSFERGADERRGAIAVVAATQPCHARV